MLNIKQPNNLVPLALGLGALAFACCKPQEGTQPATQPKPAVDLSNWKPDPNLPKPEITAKVEIIKEREHHKVSMKVTATEAHDGPDCDFGVRYLSDLLLGTRIRHHGILRHAEGSTTAAHK